MEKTLWIDLSHWETYDPNKKKHVPFDWVAAKAMGITGATIRASIGRSVDDQYVDNVADARAAGVDFLSYHYYHKTDGTPQQQAATFLSVAVARFLLDLEEAVKSAHIASWLSFVGASATDPIKLYSSPGIIKAVFKNTDTWVRKYRLLIAHWNTAAPLVPLPFVPSDVDGWQFTATAWAQDYGVRNGTKEASLYEMYA